MTTFFLNGNVLNRLRVANGLATKGDVVAYKIDGKLVFAGRIEYATEDGWIGLRMEGERIDEIPADKAYRC